MKDSGKLLAVVQVPHPPIMLKNIAKAEYPKVEQTAHAMQQLVAELQATKPDAMIIITPHGPVFSDAIAIYDQNPLKGDLAQFGAPQIQVELPMDRELAKAIMSEAAKLGVYTALLDETNLSSYGFPEGLDHGVVAPLSFFQELISPAVVMSMGLFPPLELYAFGNAMRKAIKASGKKVLIIVSGDMSHRITPSAPAGYHPHGEVFDKAIYEALREGNFQTLFYIPQDVCENAGECGYRALVMGIGALEGMEVESKIYSYQAPFGVGYLVARFTPISESPTRNIISSIQKKQEQEIHHIRMQESKIVKLARQTVEKFVSSQEIPIPEELAQKERAGVFVSIKKSGQLRGCIGTTEPTTESIAHEVIRNAINAAIHDPRFDPITENELPYLTYSVDVLTDAVPVQDKMELDPKKYGVIVKGKNKSGLLLPDLEGVNSIDEQLRIVLQKAGIGPSEDYDLFKFEVIRYK